MAEEKKSRSKRPSSLSKRSKDVESDVDADVNVKQVDARQEEENKESTVENSKSGGEMKQRRSKKRRLGQDEQERDGLSASMNEEKEDKEEHKPKKKKVSFQVDTKVKSPSPSPVEGNEEAEADDENRNASNKDKKKKKKEKSKKKTEDPTDNDSTSAGRKDESPVLAYLDQYHNDKSAWKFQKIREVQLFKHVLSLEYVPTSYEAALLSYLQGLRGEAAKQRLREVAHAAVKTDVEETRETNVESSETPSDEQALSPMKNYTKAIYAFRTKLTEGKLSEDLGESFEQLDAEMLERFRKRRRAEIILFAIDGRVCTMSNLKAPPQKGKNAQNQPANKKKKNRTAVVDISSSSDSDSEDDEEDSNRKKNTTQLQPAGSQPARKKKNRTAVIEISSSSESESSSSDSSSDSDSASSSSS